VVAELFMTPTAALADVVLPVAANLEYDVCSANGFTHLADDLTTHTMVRDLPEEGRRILGQLGDWVTREKSVRFTIGTIASGERNVDNAMMRRDLSSAFRAVACTWETAAVLKTARLNDTKALALRVITDNAGEDMAQELSANWREALAVLYAVLDELLSGGWLARMLRCVRRESGLLPAS